MTLSSVISVGPDRSLVGQCAWPGDGGLTGRELALPLLAALDRRALDVLSDADINSFFLPFSQQKVVQPSPPGGGRSQITKSARAEVVRLKQVVPARLQLSNRLLSD